MGGADLTGTEGVGLSLSSYLSSHCREGLGTALRMITQCLASRTLKVVSQS